MVRVEVLVGLLVGVVVGALAVALIGGRRTRGDGGTAPALPLSGLPVSTGRIPAALLGRLPVVAVALDAADEIAYANTAAQAFGVVRGGRLAVTELRALARVVRRDGVTREIDLLLPGDDLARTLVPVRATVSRLEGNEVAVTVENRTEATRVEAVRRDFVANVGHEIKTPVGALSLLAEAALGARDDPEAVQRFLSRIIREAARLTRLVQELIELSRLQGGEPLPEPVPVALDDVVSEATDRARAAAEAKRISVTCECAPGVTTLGSSDQLVTALSNLLDNAVAYSAEGGRVSVTTRAREDRVELVVADQGIGIAEADRERIFERFYRVDPARSRATGGTGLGLAIVKHIVTNHGGDVTVWSEPAVGSTFTIRLPLGASVAPRSQEAS